MSPYSPLFKIEQNKTIKMAWGDGVVIVGIAVFLYFGLYLAERAAETIPGPDISLSPDALPYYAVLSFWRMTAAYGLSLLFTLVYGSLAAKNRLAERFLLPVLDILQSVPILSFLPVVLLSLSAVLPQRLAIELASIVLIFTSQVWNMTFSWYQSLITIPGELREASTIFCFGPLLRFKVLELPFAAISLIWNSMMSWAGGWFFLMAAEMFTVGERDFRLPGLGAYLHKAADQGQIPAVIWGIGTLIGLIVALDQLIWRPLLAWSDRYKLETVEGEAPPSSWFYDALSNSQLVHWLQQHLWNPVHEKLERASRPFSPMTVPSVKKNKMVPVLGYLMAAALGIGLFYGLVRAGQLLLKVSILQWGLIAVGLGATLMRVLTALIIAFFWTVPLGVAIGTNPRLAGFLQPLVQIIASIPATAVFPVLLLFMLKLPGGLNLAAVFLMLMGTQWYMLFNIIAGAAVIPQDLKYTTILMHLSRWERWRTLILPALFPYIITGGIAAGGGAWNASIVAEYIHFGGKTVQTVGIGAVIAGATASADYPLLLAATLSLIIMVVTINRFGWRRLYRLAQDRFRLE